MRRLIGPSAHSVAAFLSQGSDDAGCRFLCETAGLRTSAQEDGISQATLKLSRGTVASAQNPPMVEMLGRVS